MNIIVNQNKILLNNNNYLSSGGEGDIYKKNNTIYKIYQDPSKVILVDKINELSKISNQNVIRPIDIIHNTSGKPIGYTMRYVSNTYPLCQLLTKSFKERNNISSNTIQDLIKKFRNIVSDIHQAKIIIVDLNELNFLISNSHSEIFAIDTDSYQTQSFKATAIMDSIRDRHNDKFSELTDWFSFGILTFQMFIGIHPFKGKYKTNMSLNERMLKNISVFDLDVSIPKAACYPLDSIPEVYRNWYKRIFSSKERLEPPKSFENVAVIINSIIESDSFIDISLFNNYEGNVKNLCYSNGVKILTDKFIYLTDYKKISHDNENPLFCTSPHGTPILAQIKNNKLFLLNLETKQELPCDISCTNIMVYNNQLYIKNLDFVLELNIIDLPNSKIVSAKQCAQVLENSSVFFDGVLIQNILGTFYASIFPERGKHYQINIPELKGFRVIDAKYDSKVLMVIANKNNEYSRFIFRFSNDFTLYDCRILNNIDISNINFTVLDNGTVVSIKEDQNIELFSNKKDSSITKIVKNSIISSSNKLSKIGNELIFFKDNSIYKAKMK